MMNDATYPPSPTTQTTVTPSTAGTGAPGSVVPAASAAALAFVLLGAVALRIASTRARRFREG